MSTPLDPDQLVRVSFRHWFPAFASVKGTKPGEVYTFPNLKLNALQNRIDEAIRYCEKQGIPCKILVLKERKAGVTTYLVGKSYHLLRSSGASLLQIGDKAKTTQTMIEMLEHYQETDKFSAWGNTCEKFSGSATHGGGLEAKWTHGATAKSETAGADRPGQGSTPTIIHAEEVAHWGKEGAAVSATSSMLALLNAIAEVPGAYVFVSSTANGVGNWYYETHKGASTLDQLKSGQKGNGWIKVFQAWHESTNCRMPVTHRDCDHIDATMTAAEERGCQLYGWSYEQIAWRRHVIASKCNGSEHLFNQENPEDEETCFLMSGRPVFSQDSLLRLEMLVKNATPQHGFVSKGATGFLFTQDNQDGWCTVWEKPEYGRSYIISLDTMRGEQSEGSRNADCHSSLVIRGSYIDAVGRLHNARVVARLRHPCRWDATPTAQKTHLLSQWYGNCMIVPEINKGLDVLNALKDLNANIYRRERIDQINAGRTIMTIGWETTEQTRPLIVSAVSDVVRDGTLDAECPNLLSELRTFIRDSRGKALAASGCHDDDVISLGIGLANIHHASILIPPPVNPMFYQSVSKAMTTREEALLGGACS